MTNKISSIAELIGNKVYVAPYNPPAVNLFNEVKNLDVNVLAYVDSFKTQPGVISPEQVEDYDYVLIQSPNYWKEIAENFDKSKVLLYRKSGQELISYNDYLAKLNSDTQVDVLLMPFNKSNITDLSLIARELKQLGLSSVMVDFDSDINCNSLEGFKENPDISVIHKDSANSISKSITVASIDWEQSFARPFLTQERQRGALTMGIVDGIEDFEDSDYDYERNAYNTVEHVLLMGRDDQKHLAHKTNKTSIIGLPKMYNMYRETVNFPNQDKVVINVNFTYGTFEEVRENWVNDIKSVCDELNLPYTIAQHHADNGKFSSDDVSSENIYDTIRKNTIVISRFSTVILESLALGKPVVYYNPHNETVKLYKSPMSAYDIASDRHTLKQAIVNSLLNKEHIRQQAFEFLDKKCNISSPIPPAKLAAYRIKNLLDERDKVDFSSEQCFEIDPRYSARNAYNHYDDQECEDEWQLEVYLHALGLMVRNNFNKVVDIGCGSGFKLKTYLSQYDTTGYELPENVSILKQKYPDHKWKTSNFVSHNSFTTDVVICSDVIEHLVNPDQLLTFIQNQSFEYLVLSTPERDLVYCDDDPAKFGPPKNMTHQREWNFQEFYNYVSRFFDVVDHRVTNLEQATQMMICKQK